MFKLSIFRNSLKISFKRPRLTASFLKSKILCLVILATGCLLLATSEAQAQEFSLTPSAASNSVGQEFTVDLNIDTQSASVASADVKLTFDTAVLEVVKVTNGSFFSDMANYIGAGKVFIGGFFQDESASKTGTGKMATLTLKGVGNGTSKLAFVCSTAKDDSNIFDASGNDIIKCTTISDGSYTISGGTTLPTSTPTASASATKTTTPTSTSSATATPPQSGMFLPTVLFGAAGVLLTIFGIALIL